MINATNVLAERKAYWPSLNFPETRLRRIRVPGPVATLAGFLHFLDAIPRTAGLRIFAVNDAEAAWHGWRTTELRGGLARRYRDHRFEQRTASYRGKPRETAIVRGCPQVDRFPSRDRRCRFDMWTEHRAHRYHGEYGRGGMGHRRYDSL